MGERGFSFKSLIFMNYIDYHFNSLLYFDIWDSNVEVRMEGKKIEKRRTKKEIDK